MNYQQKVDDLFDELIGSIEGVRAELLDPSMVFGSPEWVAEIKDLTDVAHLTLHDVIWQLRLSPTEGNTLVPPGKDPSTEDVLDDQGAGRRGSTMRRMPRADGDDQARWDAMSDA